MFILRFLFIGLLCSSYPISSFGQSIPLFDLQKLKELSSDLNHLEEFFNLLESWSNTTHMDWANDWKSLSSQSQDKLTKDLALEFGQARVRIRQLAQEHEKSGSSLTEEQLYFVQRITNALRFGENHLLEIRRRKNFWDAKKPWVVASKDFSHFDPENISSYKPGDILLSRGESPVSAMIARLPMTDTHFSHLAIVGINPRSGENVIVETLIETGAHIITFEEYKQRRSARGAVYRHPNRQLATLAAILISQKVYKSQNNPIPYNFSIDLNDHHSFFCSQLVREAYRYASLALNQEEVLIPKYLGKIDPLNKSMALRLGITVDQTFFPADMEWELGFDLIAEYSFHPEVFNIMLYDLVLSAMLDHHGKYGYELHPTLWIKTKGALAKFFAYLIPAVRKKVNPKMPLQTLTSSLTLIQTTDLISSKLAIKESEYEQEFHLGMSFGEAMNTLANILLEDYETSKKTWKFRSDSISKTFRPKESPRPSKLNAHGPR